MKLEVGMYVRTDKGIKKITTYEFDNFLKRHYVNCDKTHWGFSFGENEIKASHNIIELIEVGDFITLGENCYPLQVMNIWEFAGELNIELSNKAKFEDIKSDSNFKIYSIVTKEQFESMSYKVGE